MPWFDYGWNAVGTTVIILQRLSYINFYTLNELRFVRLCTQIDLVVVYKKPRIVNTDALWFYKFNDMTDVLSRVPTFGLYLFCNTAVKLSHGIGLSYNYSATDHSFFHSLTVVSLFQLIKQSVRQSVCPSI